MEERKFTSETDEVSVTKLFQSCCIAHIQPVMIDSMAFKVFFLLPGFRVAKLTVM